ncbi:MAG: Unknown protein [uncultured Sulfurovum sp.]|uniref:Uncharacterized protein n=1 Tax=uncultured Sulfurovum sp. TaxID=269237 RepID=A0A6S6ST41_9BACT|nr:MAG: Unknown protein [uncultured Sulfurovum sp.]
MKTKTKILQLELALLEGAKAEIKGDRVIITIDTEKTKRDIWENQIEMWLTIKGSTKTLSSGYLRVVRDKLKFKQWQ